MNKVLAILMLLAVLQFSHSQAQLVNCLKKLKDQAGSMKPSNELPKCVDKDALKQAQQGFKFFMDLCKEITNVCKTNIQECPKQIGTVIDGKQEQIKTNTIQMATQLIQAFSGCLETLQDNMSDIDEFIANGCEFKAQ